MIGMLEAAIDWLWAHLDQVRNWATLIFAGVGAYVGLRRHQRDRLTARAAKSDRWSLIACYYGVVGKPPPLLLALKLTGAAERPVRLHALTVVEPRGARIARAAHQHELRGETGYKPDTYLRRLVLDRDLTGDRTTSGNIRPDSLVLIFVEMPRKPFLYRSPSARLRIAIESEDMSASRSSSRLIVRSHPIAWAASSAVIAK